MALKSPRQKKMESWQLQYYSQLVGKRVEVVSISEDGFPTLVLDNGWRLEVSRDEEGNGPGFLFGIPTPSRGHNGNRESHHDYHRP